MSEHQAEKNEKFPNGLEAFFVVVALFAAEFLMGAAFHDMRGWLSLAPAEEGVMVALLGSAVVFTALMHFKNLRYRDLFHSAPSSPAATLFVLTPAIVLTIPALILAMSAVSEVMVRIFPLSSWEVAMFAEMSSGSLAAIIGACILAPMLEEMLFRGIILRSFLHQYSKWSAIVGSATLFGFAHMNLYQFVVAFVLGIVSGWLYERSASLLPCIALHAAYNTSLTVLELAADSASQQSVFMLSPTFWGAAFLLGGAGIVMLRRLLLVPAGPR